EESIPLGRGCGSELLHERAQGARELRRTRDELVVERLDVDRRPQARKPRFDVAESHGDVIERVDCCLRWRVLHPKWSRQRSAELRLVLALREPAVAAPTATRGDGEHDQQAGAARHAPEYAANRSAPTLTPWRRRLLFRVDSSSRSSPVCRESARSTRSGSRSAQRRSRSARSRRTRSSSRSSWRSG